jgi:hypothetical protein
MFQFNDQLEVSERVKAKCDRRPRYNSERDARGGIKVDARLASLFDLHQARLSLDAVYREFREQHYRGRDFVSPSRSYALKGASL